MRKVRAQIEQLHQAASPDTKNKMILGVARRLTELTVKSMAMDRSAMEKVVRTALKEPANGPMELTKSMQDLFAVRQGELANSSVSVPRLNQLLNKRDYAPLGTHARGEDVRDLAMHLCNELNSVTPLSKPVLAFVSQVNKTQALGLTTEDWTLKTWKEQFSGYDARTPRGFDPVITGLTQMHLKSPSLAQTARPDALGVTELVHKVANNPLAEELRNLDSSAQSNVVRALFQEDYEGARAQVLLHRRLEQTPTIIVGANLDTSALDNAGLSM